MANMFGAVDFGFRPIRPEDESPTSGPAISTATAMDCGFSPRGDVRPEPVDSADWLETDALSDDDLFISDNETLPDATGFGARQRELNEAQAAKLAAEVTPALRSPFRGSTLRELCERFGDSCPTSATPCNVWCEVLETLRERERTKQRWRLDPNTARHMKYRTTLIEWILEVCADFGFGPTTADLAVQYMDRVLSKVNVPKTSLQLVAMCCLEVAVKYEEVEQDVPSLPKLRKCASNVYSCEIIKKMELAVLIELEWDLAMVVSAHFLEAVFAVTDGGTFPYDDVGDRHWTPACAAQLQKLCCYLHSICLQDAHLAASAGSASQLAAAIIATGRLQLNIYPVWPNELAVATGYQCDELGPIMSKILALYKDALPVQHAHPPAGGVGYEGYPGGDVDTVITAMPGSIQVGGPGCDDELVCDGGKDGREFLTPSPTGPLDSHGFFDEPMESSLGTAVYC